jgi:hypothetical protein
LHGLQRFDRGVDTADFPIKIHRMFYSRKIDSGCSGDESEFVARKK